MEPTATARGEQGGSSGGWDKRPSISGNARETALVNEPEGIRPGLVQLAHQNVIALRLWTCSAGDQRVSPRNIVVRVGYSAIRLHVYTIDNAWKSEVQDRFSFADAAASRGGGEWYGRDGDEEAHNRGIWPMEVLNEKKVPPNPLIRP